MRNRKTNTDEPTSIKLLRESLEWITDKSWDDPTILHKRIVKELNKNDVSPKYYQNSEKGIISLLKEAREWVTDKPWDDSTFLHKRLSEELNLPVSYPEHFETDEKLNEVIQKEDNRKRNKI